MRMRGLLLCLAGWTASGQAAIVVDGKLDEPEWSQAQRFDAFRVTEPLTRGEPEMHTEARVWSDANGIYIGFICDHPASIPRTRTRTPRDAQPAADRVFINIDLEGRGETAYDLTVTLGNSIQDGVISRQIQYDYDWDAIWEHAVAEGRDQWSVEYRLPWTLAPMGEVTDGDQTIGIYFQRVVQGLGRRYSFPPNDPQSTTFVADLHKIRIRSYAAAVLDLFPYAALIHDFARDDDDLRLGADLFWKPNARHQLTATLNPEFGQVESDDLVVNFSATETFFSDKRPFFTENFGLFQTDNRVLNTRRVGARPDRGTEGTSEILGALKYTGSSGAMDFGLFAALEDDSRQAKGRDFYVGRVRRKLGDALTVGWLGTHVQRPTLERQATVNALDAQWRLAPGITLSGQGLLSDVERPEPPADSPRNPEGEGRGATLRFDYAPTGVWQHNLLFEHFDQHLQLNDAGFQERNNLNRLRLRGYRYVRDYAPQAAAQESSLLWNLDVRANNQGERLPASLILEWFTRLKSTRGYLLNYTVTSVGGVDDLITRGNGPVRRPPRHALIGGLFSAPAGALRYETFLTVREGVLDGYGWVYEAYPAWYLSDSFNLGLNLVLTRVPDELIWQRDNLLATFAFTQFYAAPSLNWFIARNQELRVKFQWIAVRAHERQALRSDPAGHLSTAPDPVDSFSLSTTGLQVRYRYELAPLSDLFVVYARGGDVFRADAERDAGGLFADGLADEASSQFLVKLRYRFGL
ncbi:MAG TPA: DUF5916 domain-containing protein [Solimonas sp.]|nr:DUF5916 domain-containing protein [Solimonas sp.]